MDEDYQIMVDKDAEKKVVENKQLTGITVNDLEKIDYLMISTFENDKKKYIESLETKILEEFKSNEDNEDYQKFKKDFIQNDKSLKAKDNNYSEAIKNSLQIFKNVRYNQMKKDEIKKCQQIKDLKYNDLKVTSNIIQISVIIVSTIITFIETIKNIFNLQNNIYVTIISVILSTYIGLIVAISRFLKIDDNKETLTKLDEKQTIVINKLSIRNEQLNKFLPISIFSDQAKINKYFEDMTNDGLDELLSSVDQDYDINFSFTDKLKYTEKWVSLKQKDLNQVKQSDDLLNQLHV